MALSLKPLGDRVVIEPIEQEEVTAGGIMLPDTAKEKPQKGKVLAVGPGTRNDAGDCVDAYGCTPDSCGPDCPDSVPTCCPLDYDLGSVWHQNYGVYPFLEPIVAVPVLPEGAYYVYGILTDRTFADKAAYGCQ